MSSLPAGMVYRREGEYTVVLYPLFIERSLPPITAFAHREVASRYVAACRDHSALQYITSVQIYLSISFDIFLYLSISLATYFDIFRILSIGQKVVEVDS